MNASKLFTEDIDAIYRNQRNTPRYCLAADIAYPRTASPLSLEQEQIHEDVCLLSYEDLEKEKIKVIQQFSRAIAMVKTVVNAKLRIYFRDSYATNSTPEMCIIRRIWNNEDYFAQNDASEKYEIAADQTNVQFISDIDEWSTDFLNVIINCAEIYNTLLAAKKHIMVHLHRILTDDPRADCDFYKDRPTYIVTSDEYQTRIVKPPKYMLASSASVGKRLTIQYFESKKEVESEILRQVAAISNLTKKEIKKAPWFTDHYPFVEYKDEDNAVRYEWLIKELP